MHRLHRRARFRANQRRHGADLSALRAVGATNFGHWVHDPLGRWDFQPTLDSALLAKLTGITIIDDFPGRDQAHGGRGGPCEATGLWMMLSDRAILPGRIIRAVIDLAETARVTLLPPRQPIQLPSHLQCRQVVPLLSLLDGLARILLRQPQFDVNEQQAIQGRSLNELAAAWDRVLPGGPTTWSPDGIDVEPLLDVVRNWHVSLVEQVTDVFCTAIHWSSRRLVDYLRRDLPQSQPVGQILLAGPARVHGFIAHLLTQQLPGIEVMRADDFGVTSECWEAIAAAILAMLHVDQVPANTYALTGVETPRVLGRISPGPPGNWHGVLADMARTLPEKMTLRSAI